MIRSLNDSINFDIYIKSRFTWMAEVKSGDELEARASY